MDKQQYQVALTLTFPTVPEDLITVVDDIAREKFSVVSRERAYIRTNEDGSNVVVLTLRAEASGAPDEDIDPAPALLATARDAWPDGMAELHESIRLNSYTVSVLDTEHRAYDYQVYAIDEVEAGGIAWDQAAENYHGPRQILSVI